MTYLLKRIGVSALFFFFFTVAIFMIGHMMPGSIADYYFGSSSSRDDLDSIESYLIKSHSLVDSYVQWLKAMVTGDLGYSVSHQRPIIEVITESMLASIGLITGPLILSFVLSFPLGLFLAVTSHDWRSKIVYGSSLLLSAVPTLFFALLFQYFFSIKLNIFPISSSITTTGSLIMPKLIIFITNGVYFVRSTRAMALHQIGLPFYHYGGYLGLKPCYFYGYWLIKPLLSSAIILFNGQLIASLSGMLLVETLFDYHGMGRLLYQSVLSRDIPLLTTITTLFFTISSVLYLVVDYLAFIIDRRNSDE